MLQLCQNSVLNATSKCTEMNLLIIIFSVFVYINYCHGRTYENLKVRIDDGEILGRYMTSHSGRSIRAFMSIPFAEPPVGDLRFKAPQKNKPWTGILNAQNPPPACTQTNMLTRYDKSVFGQEDCLYLNVYAPEVSFL